MLNQPCHQDFSRSCDIDKVMVPTLKEWIAKS
jgi:hypothetical protein